MKIDLFQYRTLFKTAYKNITAEDKMMPLSMTEEGVPNIIKKVGGKEKTRQFLENLGFVVGGTVTVVSEAGGNLIVNVKNSRIAIGKEMANKILV